MAGTALRRTVLCTLALLCASRFAWAGPPLISDDPHTVGAGHFQPIVSVSSIEQGGTSSIVGPSFDLTLGLVNRLDLLAILSPAFSGGDGDPLDGNAIFAVGFKWQFVQSEHWNLAFTPAIRTGIILPGEFATVLPIQIEYARDRLTLGTDLDYIIVGNSVDSWLVTAYGGWALTHDVSFLAEFVSQGRVEGRETDLIANLGLDWQTPWPVHLLLSGGTGIATFGGPRFEWLVYSGLQFDFDVW